MGARISKFFGLFSREVRFLQIRYQIPLSLWRLDTITDGLGELGALGVAAQVTGADAGADGVEAGALDAVGMLHQVQVAQHHNGGQQQGGGVGQILAGNVRGGTVDLVTNIKEIPIKITSKF